MRIEQLYEYIVLAHYMNYASAASNLHVSQPNLSKHISDLEQEMKVRLFNRSPRLELTPAGTAFLEDAIQIHHLYKDSLKRAQEIHAQEIQELVIQEPFSVDALGEITFKSAMLLKDANKHINIRYYREKSRKPLEMLDEGKVDIALTVDCSSMDWIRTISKKKNLVFYPVVQEPLYVWMDENHPLASKTSISLFDLTQVPINMTATRSLDPMRYAILDLFKTTLGMRPNLQVSVSASLNEFFLKTGNKDAVFLVSTSAAHSSLLSRQVGMISRQIDDDRAYLTSFIVFKNTNKETSVGLFLDAVERVAEEYAKTEKNGVRYLGDIL